MTLVRVAGPRAATRLGPLDPREAAWRPDLADIALASLVTVPHYARPVPHVALRPVAVQAADSAEATAVSELLPGEGFAVLDEGHGHAWGFSIADHYVGHVPLDALAPGDPAATTHMAGPGDALLFAAPDIKAPVVTALPAGSRVTAAAHDERFLILTAGPHAGALLHRRHALPAAGDAALDWVAVAEGFLGSPYRWGGRSRAGVDCSGLVQVARLLAGRPTRRDSDMQQADSTPIGRAEAGRGDLAFWPGHVGILLDADWLLHANAHAMAVTREPLAAVEARIGAPASFARPGGLRATSG
ncbi:MAG: NlpC/P60 family protein [Thermaurantiacus tibetensis]